MKKLVIWVVVIIAAILVFPRLGSMLRGGKAPLTEEEQRVWDRFLSKHLSSRAESPSEADADAVVAIRDKMIPHVEGQFGKAANVPGTYGKSEYWLVIVLARIGSPRAIESIVKVLEHYWPGAMGTNRETAAKALVWLGAQDKVADLEEAIADHERLVAESRDPDRYRSEVINLQKYLDLLKKGEGIRDKSRFPFGLNLIDRSHEIDFLIPSQSS